MCILQILAELKMITLGDDEIDDDMKEPVRIEITSEDNLFDKICNLHPFRDWGQVYVKCAVSKNKRGERVPGFWETEYKRGWPEDWARHNFANLQTWLLEYPSREA